ncbi:MAG: PilZ domain-containing protein [Lachnospiraceae bacterium]|nr:PilZ domain-containing protein [Lachnospiraceae bacterium]
MDIEALFAGDRRIYSRVNLSIPCLIYINNVEMNGNIVDISETGIGILVEVDEVKHPIQEGDLIMVTGVDDDVVAQFEANVIRKNDKDGSMRIGARIVNQNQVEEFINNEKVKAYLNLIRRTPV